MIDWTKDKQMWEILVPSSIEGVELSLEYHSIWDKFVTKITGGITIGKAGKGAWTDIVTGTMYEERMIPVKIVCNKDQIKEIMKFTLDYYKQIEVIAYPLSQEVIVLRTK